MKRIFTIIAFVFAAGPMLAQFTMNRTDFPDFGDSQYYVVSDTAGVTLGGGGSGQTWDFSAAFNTGNNITVSWDTATGHSLSASFPGATHVQKLGGTDYYYYTIDNDSVVLSGEQALTSQPLPYLPTATMLKFPVNLFDLNVNNVSGDFFDGFLTNVTRVGQYTVEADGAGSLTTPYATYPNVLRIVTSGTFQDSSWTGAADTDVTYFRYEWFAQGRKLPVFVFEFESVVLNGGNATESYKTWYADSQLVSVENAIAAASMTVFPNPSQGDVKVRYSLNSAENVAISLFNVMGEVVQTIEEGDKMTGDHEAAIDTDGLSKGVYFIKLRAGDAFLTKKLILN